MDQAERMEIIRLVEQSNLSVKATLRTLGIASASFYRWYKRYVEAGYDGLADKQPPRRNYWNQLPTMERKRIVELALERPDLSSLELAWHITDQEGWFVSESTAPAARGIPGTKKPPSDYHTGLSVNGGRRPFQ